MFDTQEARYILVIAILSTLILIIDFYRDGWRGLIYFPTAMIFFFIFVLPLLIWIKEGVNT